MESYSKNIPMPIIRRLPKYRRILVNLLNESRNRISSKDLAQMTGLTSSQIRHDLNALGAYGYQGYGYKVEEVLEVIERVLGSNLNYSCIIVGMDNRGIALATEKQLSKNGFIVKALFDSYPWNFNGLPQIQSIKSLEKYLNHNPTDIAILTVNDDLAQEVTNLLVKGKVKAILNFTNIDLNTSYETLVENVNVIDKFYILSCLLSET